MIILIIIATFKSLYLRLYLDTIPNIKTSQQISYPQSKSPVQIASGQKMEGF